MNGVVKVITFDKRHYKREVIEKESDYGKYCMAVADKENCKIYYTWEYTSLLNDAVPMEQCVYTYIVRFLINEGFTYGK